MAPREEVREVVRHVLRCLLLLRLLVDVRDVIVDHTAERIHQRRVGAVDGIGLRYHRHLLRSGGLGVVASSRPDAVPRHLVLNRQRSRRLRCPIRRHVVLVAGPVRHAIGDVEQRRQRVARGRLEQQGIGVVPAGVVAQVIEPWRRARAHRYDRAHPAPGRNDKRRLVIPRGNLERRGRGRLGGFVRAQREQHADAPRRVGVEHHQIAGVAQVHEHPRARADLIVAVVEPDPDGRGAAAGRGMRAPPGWGEYGHLYEEPDLQNEREHHELVL